LVIKILMFWLLNHISSWLQLNIKCVWNGHLARQQARSLFHYQQLIMPTYLAAIALKNKRLASRVSYF
jgi:hypothetical protein